MSESDSKIRKLAGYIRQNPDDSFSKFALALEFKKLDRLEKARILFENIRKNDPGYVGVYYHLGKVYELLEMNKQASIAYKEGIEIAGSKNGEERTLSELQEALQQLEEEKGYQD